MKSSRVLVLLFVVCAFGYTGSYLVLRLSHVLVHHAEWISEEGLNGHHWHEVETEVAALGTVYAPLIELELAAQRSWSP